MRGRTFDVNYFLEVTSATIVKKSDKGLERRSLGEMEKYFIFHISEDIKVFLYVNSYFINDVAF